ncbi:OmpA family protein [Candidatus Dactylopiibacterium carminicum]|nr:OmpA family protein [Candidatus Dactylopiibacterium carminicum]
MTETQRGTLIGTGIGAAAGAAIGKASGSNKVGRDAAIGAAVGAAGGYIWSSRMEQQRRAMEEATAGTGVSVSRTADDQLKLDIPSDISFAVNRADIQPNFRTVLDQFATSLRNNTGTRVDIVGHTDSTGSDAINNPLSVRRAESVRDYLVGRGVSSSRFKTAGVGASQPIADNTTASGRALNRRVEIYVGELR